MSSAGNMAYRNSGGGGANRNVTNTGRKSALANAVAMGRPARRAAEAAGSFGQSGKVSGYATAGKGSAAAVSKESAAPWAGSRRDARVAVSTAAAAAATQRGTGNVSPTPAMYTTTATVPEPTPPAEPASFIALRDVDVQVRWTDSILRQRRAPTSQRILQGSLLQGRELLPGGGGRDYGGAARRYLVKPLHRSMEFEFTSSELRRITCEEMELLRALSTDALRYATYMDRDAMLFALSLKVGSHVTVKHRIDSASHFDHVYAVVRYIGPLSEIEMGTQFGLELIGQEFRGQGTSDGIFGNYRYFKTGPDCALFVPVNKLVPPPASPGIASDYENVPQSPLERPMPQSELTHVGDLKKGATVSLQVGNSMQRARVAYMIVPPKETEPYVVVEMPKQDSDAVWNGMHNGRHVFTPRDNVFTTFVPASSVMRLPSEEYRETFAKQPSPSPTAKAKTKAKKSSEPFFAANANKPSGGRRDVSDSIYAETRLGTPDAIQFDSAHFSNGSKSKPDSMVGRMKEKLKSKWGNGAKEDEAPRSAWFVADPARPAEAAQRSRRDAEASEEDFLETDVVSEVTSVIHRDWRTVAHSLFLSRDEIQAIEAKCQTEAERTVEMLRAWQRKGTGYDSTSQLAKACRDCHFEELANELEQGLDEAMLSKVAFGVPPTKSRPLGVYLNFSDEELDSIEARTPDTTGRVRALLAKWRTRQSHNSDKIMLLSRALHDCGLRQLALEVARGLDDDIMLMRAVQIGPKWRTLATALRLEPKDVRQLEDYPEDKRPYQMLMLWRRRQHPGLDLLGALAKGLRKSGLPTLAYDLVHGVTDDMLYKLATLIGDRWEVVARHLDFTAEELDVLKEYEACGETATINTMLTKWRERHDYARDRFGVLTEALRAADLADLAAALEKERRRSEESEMVAQGGKTEAYPGFAKDKDRATRNVDRETLIAVAGKVNYRALCGVLQVPMEDQIDVENQYARSEQRSFQVLDAWRRRGDGGNRSIGQLLQVLVQLGCSMAVVDEITRRDAASNKEEANPMKQLPDDYSSIALPSPNNEPQAEASCPDLEVNSMVEVKPSDKTLFGVIRWIGVPEGSKSSQQVAGIELESAIDQGATDGMFNKKRYFQCEPNKAIFFYLSKCQPDSRFPSLAQTFSSTKRQTSQDFGGFASPLVEGFVDPPACVRPEFVGMQRGIQGDQNSCYLDSTLFSMFAYNGVFDPLLRRTQGRGDLQEYERVQTTLRESIVNPLRKNGFVRADRILQLREHLDQLGTTKGLMSEEKDPEEFLHTLLSEVFKSRPLLRIRHGFNKEVDESNIYQIFLDKDESFTLPTVEQLLLQSFQEHDLKLVEPPSCLILQMPRFGKEYKMYKRISPSLQLDITNIIEDYPRLCTVCGTLAVFECNACRSEAALEDDAMPIKNYCQSCFDRMHVGTRRDHHKSTPVIVPDHFLKEFYSKTVGRDFSEEEVDGHRQSMLTPKLMDLFAVICIQTSHYVAFVKAGTERDSEWVFFDSMADRQGDQQGYNIPQVTHLKDFRKWVDVDHIKARVEARQLTPIMERLLGDAYICLYSDREQGNQTYV